MKAKNLFVMLMFAGGILFTGVGQGQSRVHDFLASTSPLYRLFAGGPSQEKVSEAESRSALESAKQAIADISILGHVAQQLKLPQLWDYTVDGLTQAANILGPKAMTAGGSILSKLYDIISLPLRSVLSESPRPRGNDPYEALAETLAIGVLAAFTAGNAVLLPTAMYLAVTNPASLASLMGAITTAGPLGFTYMIQLLGSAAYTLGPVARDAYLSLEQTYNDTMGKAKNGTLTQAEAKAAEDKMLRSVETLKRAAGNKGKNNKRNIRAAA